MMVFEHAVDSLHAYRQKKPAMWEPIRVTKYTYNTCTALSEIMVMVLVNMDMGLLTGEVYIDLKKAFDIIYY